MKDTEKLPKNFEEKLMQKINNSIFNKNLIEIIVIVFLSTFQLFFELLAKNIPQKKREPKNE